MVAMIPSYRNTSFVNDIEFENRTFLENYVRPIVDLYYCVSIHRDNKRVFLRKGKSRDLVQRYEKIVVR